MEAFFYTKAREALQVESPLTKVVNVTAIIANKKGCGTQAMNVAGFVDHIFKRSSAY